MYCHIFFVECVTMFVIKSTLHYMATSLVLTFVKGAIILVLIVKRRIIHGVSHHGLNLTLNRCTFSRMYTVRII